MTLKFKTEKEFADWAAKAKPRIRSVDIQLPQVAAPAPPAKRAKAKPPRRIPSWLKTLGVLVYVAFLFVGMLTWRIARPFVMLSAGFFVLCFLVELLMRLGR